MSDLNSVLEFYICGCGILCCAIFGLVGNIATILLLTVRQARTNSTFTSLILWLAVIDSLFLVFISLSFSLPSLSLVYKERMFPLILPSLLPLTSIALSGSVYCVLALAVERFIHITRPSQSNKGSFFGYILPVLVFSVLYNAPKFFEFTTEYRVNKHRELVPRVRATEFRKNVDYSFYVLGSNFVFMGILPSILLILITVRISQRIKKYFSSVEKSDQSMSLLLYSIVLVQLVCHAPRTGLNMYEIYQALTSGTLSLPYPWLVDMSHLLLSVSSASNVIIFAAQDMRFRSLLVRDLKKVLFLYRQRDNQEHVEEQAEEEGLFMDRKVDKGG